RGGALRRFDVGLVDPAGRRRRLLLHDVALEEADDALPIALYPEQALTLAPAQQVVQAVEPELPLVERLIDVAQELLDLPEVHRPPRRLLRDGEEPAHFRDRLGGSRYALRLAVLRLAGVPPPPSPPPLVA